MVDSDETLKISSKRHLRRFTYSKIKRRVSFTSKMCSVLYGVERWIHSETFKRYIEGENLDGYFARGMFIPLSAVQTLSGWPINSSFTSVDASRRVMMPLVKLLTRNSTWSFERQ